MKQAFEAKKYAFAADYIRFYALYNYGGIYLDSDVEVLRSFDPLLGLPYFAGAETAGTIEAAVLGAEKGCDWVKQCLDYYEGRRFVREDGSYDIRMLPEIMQEQIPKLKPIVKVEGGLEALKRKDLDEAVCILPAGVLLAQGLRLTQSGAHARHLRHPPLPELVVLAQGLRLLPGPDLFRQPLRIPLRPQRRTAHPPQITRNP